MNYTARLAELGITLPKAAAPVASYVPVVVHGGMAYVSGDDVDVEAGKAAARACGLMIVAQLQSAGLLDQVERVVKLGAFINCTADFTQQPEVANGASDLMEQIFGGAGQHARAAVGVPALPRGAAVEVDAIIALKA
jgi:enamine deaminase RidA (YjgF/YER057c/UK114 family)